MKKYVMVSESDTIQGKRMTTFINELGCYTIAMFANMPKAVVFRDQLANLLMGIRKGEVGIISKDDLTLLKLNDLAWRAKYFETKKELFVRTKKDMNFTKARAIEEMEKDGISREKIEHYLQVDWKHINFYLSLAERHAAALKKYKEFTGTEEIYTYSLERGQIPWKLRLMFESGRKQEEFHMNRYYDEMEAKAELRKKQNTGDGVLTAPEFEKSILSQSLEQLDGKN
jgi:prophage antirepressor-like protein